MGDKGMKDKNKHNRQVNKAKKAKNEANRKKQEKTHAFLFIRLKS